MANMYYCRFQNTHDDFQDCLWHFEDHIVNGGTVNGFIDTLSKDEKIAFDSLSEMVFAFSNLLKNDVVE